MLEDVKAAIEAETPGAEVVVLPLDLSDLAALPAKAKAALAVFGHVDVTDDRLRDPFGC